MLKSNLNQMSKFEISYPKNNWVSSVNVIPWLSEEADNINKTFFMLKRIPFSFNVPGHLIVRCSSSLRRVGVNLCCWLLRWLKKSQICLCRNHWNAIFFHLLYQKFNFSVLPKKIKWSSVRLSGYTAELNFAGKIQSQYM